MGGADTGTIGPLFVFYSFTPLCSLLGRTAAAVAALRFEVGEGRGKWRDLAADPDWGEKKIPIDHHASTTCHRVTAGNGARAKWTGMYGVQTKAFVVDVCMRGIFWRGTLSTTQESRTGSVCVCLCVFVGCNISQPPGREIISPTVVLLVPSLKRWV